jgi:hypothetical protein
MNDPIFTSFLEEQYEEAMELARGSDLLDLDPIGPSPHRYYHARFRCKGLVSYSSGVVEADDFRIGFCFPYHYLRGAEAPEVLRLISPIEVFHPNVLFPLICPGRFTTSTTLVDLLFQCYEILSFQKVTMDERDALNHAACAWSRENQGRFPIDTRPLRRRASPPALAPPKAEASREAPGVGA